MSWLFLFLFLALLLIIIEISTIILESTGLSKVVARFQAISLLTGTGFTTREAELITNHPVRRSVAQTIILFGSLAFAIIIALFLNFLNEEFVYSQSITGVAILSLIFLLFRFRKVQSLIKNRVKYSIGKSTTLQEAYHLDEEDVVTEIVLLKMHGHLFDTLKNLQLATKYDVHILTIEREIEDGDTVETKLIKHPSGSVKLTYGDRIRAFGKRENIEKLFNENKNKKEPVLTH